MTFLPSPSPAGQYLWRASAGGGEPDDEEGLLHPSLHLCGGGEGGADRAQGLAGKVCRVVSLDILHYRIPNKDLLSFNSFTSGIFPSVVGQ